MHGHETVPEWVSQTADVSVAALVVLLGFQLLFMTGLLPIPVGYDRGKVRFIMWCGTGMHVHHVYWTGGGFQTLHPSEGPNRRPSAATDRGAIFPYAVAVLSFVLFVPLYVGYHAANPVIIDAAESATTNPDALGAIGWADAFVAVVVPFLYLAMLFAYFNVRANRDARF